MANGNNRRFLEDPMNFITNSVYVIADNTFTQNGIYGIDLVSERNVIRLENFDATTHRSSARPVRSYILRSVTNSDSAMQLDPGANYLFTPMLTGCMFAAYGSDRNNVTVSHVNALDGSARIRNKIANIRDNYAFYKILCRNDDAAGINDTSVFTYDYNEQHAEQTLVFGMYDAAEWHFYRKPADNGAALTEM